MDCPLPTGGRSKGCQADDRSVDGVQQGTGGIRLRCTVSQKRTFAQLEEWYPGQFQIEYDRDSADYVYESEKLATLSGKKLHGKRKSYQ